MAPTGFADLPTEALDEIARRVGPLDNVACSHYITYIKQGHFGAGTSSYRRKKKELPAIFD
jgi:hypothetical protein